MLINLQNHFFCALAVLIFFDWQGSPFNDLLLKMSLEKNISLKPKIHAVENIFENENILENENIIEKKISFQRKISLAEAASRPRCRKALGLCAAAQMENLTVGKIGCWRNL